MLLLLLACLALAQDVHEEDFEAVEIRGAVVGPRVDLVRTPPPAPVVQLFHLRRDFAPEIRASLAEVL